MPAPLLAHLIILHLRKSYPVHIKWASHHLRDTQKYFWNAWKSKVDPTCTSLKVDVTVGESAGLTCLSGQVDKPILWLPILS